MLKITVPPVRPKRTSLVSRGVIARMLSSGGELVTALLGAGAPAELAGELEDYLRHEHPEADLVVYRGGQAESLLALGVE